MERHERVKATEHGGVIGTWKKKHTQLFAGATRHPFILSIRDGTVDLSSFKRWLGQDYIFVKAFVPFVASVLVKACKEESSSRGDMEVLLGGMASLNDEISWFKKEASKWGVQLSTALPQKPNQKYCRLVESLMGAEVDYTVAMAALWAIEVVYQESFAACLEEGSKTPAELKEACQRWGNEGFGEYCRTLEEIANRRLAEASDDVISKAEATLLSILQHEVDFWNMSQGVYE